MNTVALPAPAQTLTGQGRLGACVGAVALVSLLAFEAMALAAAMPAIAQALDGIELYALSFGGLLATSVLGMVLAGRSCDRHGARPATLGGLTVFAAGLLLAGLADDMGWVVAGRIVQGLGGGMLGVTLYVGMGQLVPASLHPRLFALMAAAWVVPALIGPAAAAAMVQWLGWRSVFLGVAAAVPLAAALLLPAFARLPVPVRTEGAEEARRGAIGWAALGALGALLLHTASQAGGSGWMLLCLFLGLAAAGLAARRLLPVGSLRATRGLPAVIALRGLLAAAFATAEVFLPLYLTREEGWSLSQAGLALSTGAVWWSCGSAVQSRIVGAPQRQRILQAGLLLVALGITVVATQLHMSLHGWVVIAGWSLAGLGIGMSFPMLSVLTLSLSAPAAQGHGASALQLSDALCSSAALAVAGVAFSLVAGASRQGFALVFAVAIALALGAALLGRRAFV